MSKLASHDRVLVCGIPGTGKTTYCEWLEREKQFLHLDFDQLLDGKGDPIKVSFVDLLRRDRQAFTSELSK